MRLQCNDFRDRRQKKYELEDIALEKNTNTFSKKL